MGNPAEKRPTVRIVSFMYFNILFCVNIFPPPRHAAQRVLLNSTLSADNEYQK